VYRAREVAAEIHRLARLDVHGVTLPPSASRRVGRNRLTRVVDQSMELVRQYLPPVHWTIARLLALLLFGYARGTGATVERRTGGRYAWPELPSGSVVAIWHGNLPALLGAMAGSRPKAPVRLMVSRDPRGDSVALFCKWLGFEIVRGDAQHGGWRALLELGEALHRGEIAVISPDGSGPPWVASVGAVVLAAATGAPLIPMGTDCRPAVFERHKWDAARNPLPWGQIGVVCGEPLRLGVLEDAAALEQARTQLQSALNSAAQQARALLYGEEPHS
jgi:lysophospholipid acyltransferase (LPLAT)-like uncharacterized protein